MSRIAWPAIIATAAMATLSGCSTSHIFFADDLRREAPHLTEEGSTIRVFYDRHGWLYPDGTVPIPAPPRGSRDRTLMTAACANPSVRCDTPGVWPALVARYATEPVSHDTTGFLQIQDAIRADVLDGILRTTPVGQPVVFVVHGFNVPPPRPGDPTAIDAVADSIRTWYSDTPLTIVEVRWDGLDATPDAWAGIGTWKRAQAYSYFIGIELRRLLTAVPHDRPLRVVSHSLGGSVLASSLWNVSSKIQDWTEEVGINPAVPVPPDSVNYYHPWVRYYAAFTDARYRTPTHPDMRVGMVVPAMPPDAFATCDRSDFYDRNVEGRSPLRYPYSFDPTPSDIDRIVIGYNPRDRVVGKDIGKIFGISASEWGSTAAAAVPRTVRWTMHDVVNGPLREQTGSQTEGFGVSLQDRPDGEGEKEHGFSTYVDRVNSRTFFDCLFTDVCVGDTLEELGPSRRCPDD